jgi:DNA adenine methylase
VYRVIKNKPDALIADLKKHENNSAYFYAIRNLDRTLDYRNLSDIERGEFNSLYEISYEI